MDYRNCDKEIVFSFFGLINMAISNYKPDQGLDIQDIELLLDAMRVLRPKLIELEIFKAMMQQKTGLVDDAIQTLKQVVEINDNFIYGKGLLAFYLFESDDQSWRPLSAEILKCCDDASKCNLPEVDAAIKMMQMMEMKDALRSGTLSTEQLIELTGQTFPNGNGNGAAGNAMPSAINSGVNANTINAEAPENYPHA